MAILVDDAVWPWRQKLWAHLISDESFAELHAFASLLGVPREAFQGDHYDIHTAGRARAIVLGAQAVNSRELVRRLRDAGLRRRSATRPADAIHPSVESADQTPTMTTAPEKNPEKNEE